MLNYVQFYTHIWSDKKFRSLSDNDARLLFIFLFANSSITLTGIYNLDLETCKIKTKTKRDFDTVFNEIIDNKMIMWDNEAELVFVINRFKLIPNKSAKIIEGAISELNMLIHSFKYEFIKKYNEYFGNYKPILKDFKDTEFNLLTQDQIDSWIKLGWQKQRIKRFYLDRQYTEQKIDELINQYFPNLK